MTSRLVAQRVQTTRRGFLRNFFFVLVCSSRQTQIWQSQETSFNLTNSVLGLQAVGCTISSLISCASCMLARALARVEDLNVQGCAQSHLLGITMEIINHLLGRAGSPVRTERALPELHQAGSTRRVSAINDLFVASKKKK